MTGNEMRNFRMSAGLLQVEIAAELGMDNQTVCRWENSGAELKKVYSEMFERLVRDAERIAGIKAGHRMRRRKARLVKRKLHRELE